MKIGIVGATYQQVSLPFDAQRSINLFPVIDQTGKEVGAMYGTPGLYLFNNFGGAAVREMYKSQATNRAFAIVGSNVLEVFANGSSNIIGTLNGSSGLCYMCENPLQLAICDGQYLYIFVYATNTFKQIVGGLSYVTNGNFAVGTGWTLGSGWSIANGFANAANASADLSQTSPVILVNGKSYTLQYTMDGVSYVANGNFVDTSSWTTGAGWTIGGGVATASTSSAALSQTAPNALVSGETYNVTFTVTRSAGSVAASLGGGTPGASISASGTQTQQIVAGASQTIAFTGTTFTGTVSIVSITLVGTGTITPKIGGTSGVQRNTPGTYVETIVAAATQTIAFTGSNFEGSISNITITDQSVGLPASVGSVTYIDGFFIVSKNGTSTFYKSALNDGTSWSALDFASASSAPGNLFRPIAAVGQLWLLCNNEGEIWTNTGAALFPFQKIAGGKMTMGILAPASAKEFDNTVFWVGANENGFGIVYRAQGFIPRRISTTPIETMIRLATDPTNIRAYTYQQDGHLFYVLTGGGLATSLVYDVTTDMWHERAYMNSQGMYEQHLGCCYMFAFGMHLVGDRNTGNIYVMDINTYQDNGQPLVAERIYTHLSDEQKRIRYNSLVIGVESGVGLQSGQGSDPQIELQLSVDGARTWSDSFFTPIGKVGAYKNKAEFRRLGVAEQMTFKIRISDPVPRHIVGSYLK